MGSHLPQLTSLFRNALELCDVTADESVLVVSQAESRDAYVSGYLDAVEALGAHGDSLGLPGFKQPMFPYGGGPSDALNIDNYIQTNRSVQGALENADVVIDTTTEGLIHTKARELVLDNDARMLTCWEPPAVLERMFPREDLRQRVERSEELLESANRMRITSKSGTDVSVEIGRSPPVIGQYGYTDEPGRWDHLVSGFVACYPVDDSPSGRIVLESGDVILPTNRFVERPIEFEIADGFITDMSGDGADKRLLEGYLDRWDDRDAYATSHFGWGLDENAIWETMAFYTKRGMEIKGMDNRSYAGGFMWSTGPNRFVGRDIRAHLDFVVRGCTIRLDGTVVVEDGELAEPTLQPDPS